MPQFLKKIQEQKKVVSLGLFLLLAVVVYFLYSYQFLPYSLGLHPDNINNLNLASMLSSEINPNEFAQATFEERELFNFAPAIFIFYSWILRLVGSPVAMLDILNYVAGLASFLAIYQVTKQWFGQRTAFLTLIGCLFSVWFVLIFRLNFTPYIALCFFAVLLLYFYWGAIEKKSRPHLFLFALVAAMGFVFTTWTIFVVFLYLVLYSVLDSTARPFIFERKNITILLGVLVGAVSSLYFLSQFWGVEGNPLSNYVQYFYNKRFPEHGGGVHNDIPLSSRFYVLNLMMNNYYEFVCTLWGHQRVVARPIQIIQPFWMITAVLGIGTGFLTRNKRDVFLSAYVLFVFLFLTAIVIPNERYFVIVIPFVYMLACVFLVRVLDWFPLVRFNKNHIFAGLCLASTIVGMVSIKNNYFPYNKIINDYIVGAADRRRHGIEQVRRFLEKKERDGQILFVSYNINSDRIDIGNFYGLNYGPTKQYLPTQEFLSSAAKFSKSENEKISYVFDFSHFLQGGDEIENALLALGFTPAERLYDLSGNQYKTIYVLEEGLMKTE